MSILNKWLSRSEENKKTFLQESLIVEVTETLYGLMIEKGITQAAIAEKLGVTPARISNLFRGKSNITLRTLSDLCFSIGVKPEIRFVSDNCKPIAYYKTDLGFPYSIVDTQGTSKNYQSVTMKVSKHAA